MKENRTSDRRRSHLRLVVSNETIEGVSRRITQEESEGLRGMAVSDDLERRQLLSIATWIDCHREEAAMLNPSDRLERFKQFLRVSLQFGDHVMKAYAVEDNRDAIVWFLWAVMILTEPRVASSQKKLRHYLTEVIARCAREADFHSVRCEPLIALLKWLELMRDTIDMTKKGPKLSEA